jgi:hypothetical protein
MDQNPLPRGSFRKHEDDGRDWRTVPRPPRAAVAVEAQYLARRTDAMIVIEVSVRRR